MSNRAERRARKDRDFDDPPRPEFPESPPPPFAYEPPPEGYAWDGLEPYFRGFRVDARRVLVCVGPADLPNSWVNGLEGTERRAVEVTYEDRTFYIDDDDGEGTPVYPAYLGEDYPHRLAELAARSAEMQAFRVEQNAKYGHPIPVVPRHGAGSGWRHLTLGRGAMTGPHFHYRILPMGTTVIRLLEPGEGA